MSNYLHRIPTLFMGNPDWNLSPQALLFMIHITTWQKRDGLCHGFDSQLAAERLHIGPSRLKKIGKMKQRVDVAPDVFDEIEATGEISVLRREIQSRFSRMHAYQINKPIKSHPRYFMLPEKVLFLDINPMLKKALIVCFMLRNRNGYDLRCQKETLTQTFCRCLQVSARQAKNHIAALITLGFLEKRMIKGNEAEYSIKKHAEFKSFWHDLPKAMTDKSQHKKHFEETLTNSKPISRQEVVIDNKELLPEVNGFLENVREQLEEFLLTL